MMISMMYNFVHGDSNDNDDIDDVHCDSDDINHPVNDDNKEDCDDEDDEHGDTDDITMVTMTMLMLRTKMMMQVHEVKLTPEQLAGSGPLLLKIASSLSYGPSAPDKVKFSYIGRKLALHGLPPQTR